MMSQSLMCCWAVMLALGLPAVPAAAQGTGGAEALHQASEELTQAAATINKLQQLRREDHEKASSDAAFLQKRAEKAESGRTYAAEQLQRLAKRVIAAAAEWKKEETSLVSAKETLQKQLGVAAVVRKELQKDLERDHQQLEQKVKEKEKLEEKHYQLEKQKEERFYQLEKQKDERHYQLEKQYVKDVHEKAEDAEHNHLSEKLELRNRYEQATEARAEQQLAAERAMRAEKEDKERAERAENALKVTQGNLVAAQAQLSQLEGRLMLSEQGRAQAAAQVEGLRQQLATTITAQSLLQREAENAYGATGYVAGMR